MLWLDSTYPPDKDGQPGAARGDCAQSSGAPKDVEGSIPNAYVLHLLGFYAHMLTQKYSQVIWSNIRFGPVGSTVQT